ncbi:ABC transporter ATP-binding protein [Prosthecomicrobium sp. N25]|uniref:ABC transporter ATP-binding protein n=1 Tax=Prosthecomicrobium sp. N25 TaxID=3129254 RepID=UPI0030774B16
MTRPDTIVECLGLGRSYGDRVAVDSIAFSMAEGEFFALLGPNGAGKSTLLNMLTTLVAPSRGEARVAGADIRREADRVRAALGIVFQDSSLDDRLTAAQNLRIHAALHGMGRAGPEAVAAGLAWAGLEAVADQRVGRLSGGMRRRLELARALMHRPRLLILDEPTLGLDVQARRDLWSRIATLRDRGLSVLMTTHFIQEAEACSRVGVIDGGRLVALGTPLELRARHGGTGLEDVFVTLTGQKPRDGDAGGRERPAVARKRAGAWIR